MPLEKIIIIYYCIINAAAFVVYGLDKLYAKKHAWRVPEKTLLALAAFGGGGGALLAMLVFRHKTKHVRFVVLVPLFVLLHIALWYFVISKL